MIDIHNHIIYDCDDGSKNIDQSIRMIKTAREAGITEICFTPHYMEDGYKSNRDELVSKVEEIKKCLIDECIETEVYLGEEIFIYPNLPASLENVVCLNDSRYILIEIPLMEEINYIDDVIYKLFALGKTPILAHPERYLITLNNFSYIEELIHKGVLLQMNANSLIGCYGKEAKKLANKLLNNNMVHFVASDAHSSMGYINMKQSLSVLKEKVGDEKFKEITEENQRKVILNEDICINMLKTGYKKSHGIFSLFGKKV